LRKKILFPCDYIATYDILGEQIKFTMSIHGEGEKENLMKYSSSFLDFAVPTGVEPANPLNVIHYLQTRRAVLGALLIVYQNGF